MELTKEARKQIVEGKLENWKQQHYSLGLDVKIANLSDDKGMLQRAQTALKTAIVAMDTLQGELKELIKEDAVSTE